MDPHTIGLQEKVAYLERYVVELDGVVRGLNDRVDRFERETRRLRALLEADASGETETRPLSAPDDRPPHW